MKEIIEYKDLGRIEKRILEPSRGGMGTRLNILKPRLIRTIEEIIEIKFTDTALFKENLKISPKKTAIKRLAKTPALATATVPHFLFVKLSGL